jgi:7-cyano-7-deazaguanine synthase in queuosine biosynthesis
VDQLALTRSLKYGKNLFTVHFNGITANPTQAIVASGHVALPERNQRATKQSNYRRPLINIDKRGVAEHYTRLGVLEELFPVTRSCEEITTDFSKHCEVCWFCAERHWGFGRYV